MLSNDNSGNVQPEPNEHSSQLPGLVKVWGNCMGCLLGLVIGLILSLVCLIPGAMAFNWATGGKLGDPLNCIIVLTIIIALITTVAGAIQGPALAGKLLRAIGNVFRWMTGSHKKE